MKCSVVILFLLMSFISFGQNTNDTPEIKLDRTAFDFGEMLEGQRKSHVFIVENSGDSPLIITDVHTQCGCTAVDFQKEPIMPGQSAELIIEYNSSGKLGVQRKVVTIISNAAEDVKIRILAQVYTE